MSAVSRPSDTPDVSAETERGRLGEDRGATEPRAVPVMDRERFLHFGRFTAGAWPKSLPYMLIKSLIYSRMTTGLWVLNYDFFKYAARPGATRCDREVRPREA